jgi:predicted RNA binding protein YcfA (HicA-like mRNA interferase family)
MGGNLYPELARLLREAGCVFIRQAKGSHEIWFSPLTNQNLTVARNTVKRHTANKALKDTGLPKAFQPTPPQWRGYGDNLSTPYWKTFGRPSGAQRYSTPY